MDISVSSRHAEVPEAVRQACQEKFGRLSRFVDGMERAEVHFWEERNRRIPDKEVCEVTLEGHGHHVRAKVAAPDQFAAVDLAVDKLEHQLHKLKSKLLQRSHPRRDAGNGSGPGPVSRGRNAGTDERDREEGGGEGLRIVKSKRFAMKPMTPDEAALQMDLIGHSFFFFRNADTERAAVVYRRADGDVGLIDEAP